MSLTPPPIDPQRDLRSVPDLADPLDPRATAEAILFEATAFSAPTAQDLSAVYDNLQSRIGTTQEEQEVTAWFAASALVFVVLGAGLSALWFGRLP